MLQQIAKNSAARRLRRVALTGTLALAAGALVLTASGRGSPPQAWQEFWDTIGGQFAAAWPTIFAFDLGRYVVAASLMAGIVALILRQGTWRRRIQSAAPRLRDIRREIGFSLQTALIFSVIGFSTYLGIRAGLFTVDARIDPRGLLYLAASLAGMIVAHDAYFYWTHRAMHHRRLFGFFHRVHHRSVTPTPFAAYAFAWPEALVQGIFLPLWLLFVPMQQVGLFIFMTFMIVRNVMGHAGVELHPSAVATSRWLSWLCTTTHHDLHHQRFSGNYGLYFTWWDRLMGTEVADYRSQVLRATKTAAAQPKAAVAAAEGGMR